MKNKFIGKTLKDFIDYLNNKSDIYINFYNRGENARDFE